MKSNLKAFCKAIKTECNCLIMVEINKDYLGRDKNIIVSAVYIPPPGTPYASITHFDEISNDMLSYDPDCFDHLLCGDFNAHTGTKSDIVQLDAFVCGNLDEEDRQILDNHSAMSELNLPLNRYNSDNSCDRGNYGVELLNLCMNNKICIFNGRCGNDRGIGRATTTHGSVIDYVIGSPYLMSAVQEFDVLDFNPFLSDIHKEVVVVLTGSKYESHINEPHQNVHDNQNDVVSNSSSKWHEEKKSNYVDNLDTGKLDILVNNIDTLTVQESFQQINNILIDAAVVTFPSNFKRRRRQKNIEGYSKVCWQSRKQYHSAKQRYN